MFQPAVVKSECLDDTLKHVTGKVVEIYLRALRVLRGDSLPIAIAEHCFDLKLSRIDESCPVHNANELSARETHSLFSD